MVQALLAFVILAGMTWLETTFILLPLAEQITGNDIEFFPVFGFAVIFNVWLTFLSDRLTQDR